MKKRNGVQMEVHQCQHCDATFQYQRSIPAHIRDVHSRREMFMCEHCDKLFKHKVTLKRHAMEFHKTKEDLNGNVNGDLHEQNISTENNELRSATEDSAIENLERHRDNTSVEITELKSDEEENSDEIGKTKLNTEYRSVIKDKHNLDTEMTSSWKFITSNLKSCTELVLKWIDSIGCKGVGTAMGDEITHVIVGTDQEMKAERTLKYLQVNIILLFQKYCIGM